MRFFNTAGPVDYKEHYCLSPIERFNLADIISLIEQKKYFVLHAPRQTGKTTCLLALMEYLNNTGKYRALYFNVESAQAARGDVRQGMRAILSEMASRALYFLKDNFLEIHIEQVLKKGGEYGALGKLLSLWVSESQLPIILLIDEIDSLVDDTLISILRQLRAGYDKRPTEFPQSVILCGVRDVRDYRIHSSKDKAIITGGSAFNIKAKSLRLGNFSKEDVKTLYRQHTDETGQEFFFGTIDIVWALTSGQPWLVNALGYEVCFEMKEAHDRSRPITIEMIEQAKENIILRRDTHIDQLVDKLHEERVRRVIEPILEGLKEPDDIPADDLSYTIDLGLVTVDKQLQIANRIYQEVIPRELTYSTQVTISEQTSWYVNSSGKLDMDKLLSSFQEFFREHSESWVERFQYKEAGPQLLLQAFLQRIVNGGGRVDREYGLGTKRTDILLIWPYKGDVQKVVIELKVLYKSLSGTINEGLKQTIGYTDKCGTDQGHLVIFDRSKGKSWEEKIFKRVEEYQGKKITVWGM
ncbi:MAG: ATP-binding protein [bacterium]